MQFCNTFLSMILVVLVKADKAYKKGRIEYVIKKMMIIIIKNCFKLIDSCIALFKFEIIKLIMNY